MTWLLFIYLFHSPLAGYVSSIHFERNYPSTNYLASEVSYVAFDSIRVCRYSSLIPLGMHYFGVVVHV